MAPAVKLHTNHRIGYNPITGYLSFPHNCIAFFPRKVVHRHKSYRTLVKSGLMGSITKVNFGPKGACKHQVYATCQALNSTSYVTLLNLGL